MGWHIKSRSMLLPESVTALTVCSAEPADAALMEKYTTSCQRNGDIVCTIPSGTWIQVVFLSGARQKPDLIQPVCLMKNTRENYEILGYLKQSQIHKLV